MNSIFKMTSAVTGAAMLAMAMAAPASAELSRITIATGAPGTIFNQIGSAMATVLQKSTGAASTTRPMSGAALYLKAISQQTVELAITGVTNSAFAFRGEAGYSPRMPELRGLVLVGSTPMQYHVSGDSPEMTIGDLRGKKVVKGLRSSPAFTLVLGAVLATGGLTLDDIEGVDAAGVRPGIAAFTEGRVYSMMGALGMSALREAEATMPGGVRALQMGPDDSKLLTVPGLRAGTVNPNPAFVGVKEPTRVLLFETYLHANEKMSADDAYTITKAIFEGWADMQEAVPFLRGAKREELLPPHISLPLHEGAVRFYKEQGLWTDAHQVEQDALLAL